MYFKYEVEMLKSIYRMHFFNISLYSLQYDVVFQRDKFAEKNLEKC